MKRLTLEELKAHKSVVINLDAIKGAGGCEGCHCESDKVKDAWDRPSVPIRKPIK
jgi:hypothetical protein